MQNAQTDNGTVKPVMDPAVRLFVESARGSLFPPLADLPAGRLRATINAALLSHDIVGYVPEPVFRVERATYTDVPVRVYFPSTPPQSVVVYFHGGGFVAGSLDTHDKTTRRVANGAGAVVVSVDYRLSPEYPFPFPFEDARTATREAARRYPHLPLIVMGDSAGGALAACVAQWARDTGLVELAGQVLAYPVIDFDLGTRSMLDYGTDYLLTRDDLALYRHHYLDGTEGARYALPGSLTDLSGLAPAAVTVAGFDPLHDEGVRYARRLSDAGVPVELIENDDLIHGWLEVADTFPAAAAARDRLVVAVRRLSTVFR
ncbi:alpha/beta hydrolase [Leifsonia poae]|uniref:alpha/beta hydrolase n=1 Tax=Leifsonia poae TaxID=110933 RepID=UPI001CBE2BA3|nr:alpha/beta hydrolase [Leifsonia poae]